MIYEVWESDGMLSVGTKKDLENLKSRGVVEEDTIAIYSIRSDSWEEVMRIHYEVQGWGEYRTLI